MSTRKKKLKSLKNMSPIQRKQTLVAILAPEKDTNEKEAVKIISNWYFIVRQKRSENLVFEKSP